MFHIIRGCILNVLNLFEKSGVNISEDMIMIDQPKDKTLGDLYTNAAMMFSKKLGVSPKVSND